ncbi:hypothetical protein [Streptomyces fagopyri]|uniref:hypothetical protein n=1 Tax=Streptomyces fagopyri TaxID=2662397 RepID=UPI00371935B8
MAPHLAWSHATTRTALPERAALLGTGLTDLLTGLAALAEGHAPDRVLTGSTKGEGTLAFPGGRAGHGSPKSRGPRLTGH